MSENTIDITVGDDGLTDQERHILQTPVSQVAPEDRHILVALHAKKASYIFAENDRLRAEDREKQRQKIAAAKPQDAETTHG